MSDFDIVVYESTSAAVATAIQAARLGRTVALISPQRHIGKSCYSNRILNISSLTPK